jgi:hypothetical protein
MQSDTPKRLGYERIVVRRPQMVKVPHIISFGFQSDRVRLLLSRRPPDDWDLSGGISAIGRNQLPDEQVQERAKKETPREAGSQISEKGCSLNGSLQSVLRALGSE